MEENTEIDTGNSPPFFPFWIRKKSVLPFPPSPFFCQSCFPGLFFSFVIPKTKKYSRRIVHLSSASIPFSLFPRGPAKRLKLQFPLPITHDLDKENEPVLLHLFRRTKGWMAPELNPSFFLSNEPAEDRVLEVGVRVAVFSFLHFSPPSPSPLGNRVVQEIEAMSFAQWLIFFLSSLSPIMVFSPVFVLSPLFPSIKT